MTSPEYQAVRRSAACRLKHGPPDSAEGLDQITVVRIDETHIQDQSHEEAEEEESVFVIEYSNAEEEAESYQFTVSVDPSIPARPTMKPPPLIESATAPVPLTARQRRKLAEEVERDVLNNRSVLELGENYSEVKQVNGGKRLVCLLCPAPGRVFKRGSGLSVHLKQIHQLVRKKTFFCISCQQAVRTQVELDAHTKRHAHQDAVFTCRLCAEEEVGFSGSRRGLKVHLEKEHEGMVPHCHVCNKGFKSLVSYLDHHFRHVGRSPFYCARCQIYEMTERGLSVHLRNHDLQNHNRNRKQEEEPDKWLLASKASDSNL